MRPLPKPTLFPYTTLFRSCTGWVNVAEIARQSVTRDLGNRSGHFDSGRSATDNDKSQCRSARRRSGNFLGVFERSEEHTSELQSRFDLVCRLLLEKKKYAR